MSELETIYKDKKRWIFFEGEENESIGVYCRCPDCGQFLKKGQLLMNMNGDVKLKNFICNVHGEIEPYFDRDC